MTAMRRVVAAVVTAVALVSCSTESGEPRGLEGTPALPEPTAEPTAAPTTDQTSSAPSPSAEPDPSFTQPWVPGDPSVITLPDALPVENADDLDADEQAVVDALGHAMAAWDAMLFGADPEQAGLDTWFRGGLLRSLIDYSVESIMQQRVTVGSPTRVSLHDVSVDGDAATVEVCLFTDDWVEYVQGEEGEPMEPVHAYQMPAEADDDAWRFTDATSIDLRCS